MQLYILQYGNKLHLQGNTLKHPHTHREKASIYDEKLWCFGAYAAGITAQCSGQNLGYLVLDWVDI